MAFCTKAARIIQKIRTNHHICDGIVLFDIRTTNFHKQIQSM